MKIVKKRFYLIILLIVTGCSTVPPESITMSDIPDPEVKAGHAYVYLYRLYSEIAWLRTLEVLIGNTGESVRLKENQYTGFYIPVGLQTIELRFGKNTVRKINNNFQESKTYYLYYTPAKTATTLSYIDPYHAFTSKSGFIASLPKYIKPAYVPHSP